MPSLETLFNNHVADLMDIFPSISNTFICPICKNPYSLKDIVSEKLSLGDVWTNYVREKIKDNLINKHIVLLCKDCNSLAGQYGDAQSQLFEQIKDGDNTGNLYGMRSIQLKKADENPITINANISIENATNTIKISGKVNKNAQWLNNDPKMQEKILQLVGNKEPVSFFVDAKLLGTIKPKPELAPVGWITSAYLFAFYVFGYRYVLHPSLDSVREYILNSFNGTNYENIKTIPGVFDLREYDDKYFDYPEMDLIVPLESVS